jgi:hypothetical protein
MKISYLHTSSKNQNRKSPTLWSTYSMLKATINVKHNIHISKFNKLVSFLKRMSDNYKPKNPKRLQVMRSTNSLQRVPKLAH